MNTKKQNIFITLCFIVQLFAIIFSFVLVSYLKELHILKLGFFDIDNYFISLTQIIFIPLLMFLMFVIKRNSIFFKITSFLLALIFIIRGFILINMLISNSNNLEQSSFDFFSYIQITTIILTAIGIIVFVLFQIKLGKVLLKVSSISGIVINSFLLLLFILNYSFVNVQFDAKVMYLLLVVILIDLLSFIELLILKEKKILIS